MKLLTSSGRPRIVSLGLLASATVALIAAAVTPRASDLVKELQREVDRDAAEHSDIQQTDRDPAQVFVERYGQRGRKAAEYIAWRYRAASSPNELHYTITAIEVLKLLRSERSRPLLDRLSGDMSTTSYVRLSAAGALINLPGADGSKVISRILKKGSSADRRDVFFFILRDPDPRLLPTVERALQTETDTHARSLLMLAASLLKNPGKCALYAPVRQGDGSLTCFYYCPRDIDTVPAFGGETCEPLVDPETARSRSRK